MGESPHTRQSALLYQVIDLPCTEPNPGRFNLSREGKGEPQDQERGAILNANKRIIDKTIVIRKGEEVRENLVWRFDEYLVELLMLANG